MQFLILAYDGTDSDALARRMQVREAHVATIDRYRKRGNMIVGAALLDEKGAMCGSVIVADFASRAALDNWLKEEPYMVGKVWERVDIKPCKLGPSFADLLTGHAA